MEVSKYWREQETRYRLVGMICKNCETKIFPPRDVCPACKAQTVKLPKPK